jgi:hypothetical protein
VPLRDGLSLLAQLAVSAWIRLRAVRKHVVAKAIPKGKRSRLLGERGAIAGILTLTAAMVLYLGITGVGRNVPSSSN